MSLGSPPDTGFTPRKEFIKDPRTTNSFCLVAIAGSSLIRLYSFPPQVITALRRLFDQRRLIQGFREDLSLNFCEFSLDGKPWSSPKTINTEKLMLDVLAIIYQHGYSFLSTIDYGREHDDRLAITFSKPSPPTTPDPSNSPLPSAGGTGTETAQNTDHRVPFALSFSSMTILRVINPPLRSTPAILQAVRGSWPRGVVAEKKIGDATYEFKLKGYKWFQEDTFATDSLHHILSLLSSLDAHAFSLHASITLSNRSRVKDLWIFTGPGPATSGQAVLNLPDSPATSLNNSSAELRRAAQHSTQEPSQITSSPTVPGFGANSQHRRFATAPAGPLPSPRTQPHPYPPAAHPVARAATENAPHFHSPQPQHPPNHQASFPHKLMPPAHVPAMEGARRDADRQQEQQQIKLPSTVPSDVENLMGAGAGRIEPEAELIYETGNDLPTASIPQVHASKSPQKVSTPPDSRTQSPSLPKSEGDRKVPTPPLLSAGVFDVGSCRDSEFSTTDEDLKSCEVPITWTGDERQDELKGLEPILEKGESARSPVNERISVGPMLPGGWTGTPEEEQSHAEGVFTEQSQTKPSEEANGSTPVHHVEAHIASPEVMHFDEKVRKSQAGLVGVIPSQDALPLPVGEKNDGSVATGGKDGNGQGWVMVNTEGKSHTRDQSSETVHARKMSTNEATDEKARSPTPSKQSSMSPAAKTIVIVDAVEASKTKSKSKDSRSSKDSRPTSPSGLRRFFSLSKARKSSVTSSDATSLQPSNADPTSENIKSEEKEKRSKTSVGIHSNLMRVAVTEEPEADDNKHPSTS